MGDRAIAPIAALAMFAALFISTANAATSGPSLASGPAIGGGSCAFKNTEIATTASFDQTTSTKFVKVRDAGSITFTQDRAGCVAGSFFANAGNDEVADHVLLQVLLDGAVCAPLAGGYIFANSGDDFSSHSTAFFCGANVAPGKHTIQVQWASGLGGNAELFQRTLEVTHQ